MVPVAETLSGPVQSAGPIGNAEFLGGPDIDGSALGETVVENDEIRIDYSGTTYAYASRVDDLSLTNLGGTVIGNAEGVSEFETTLLATLNWEDLDSANREYMIQGLQIGVPAIVTSAASFLTVGYLAWIIRGGVLLTTFMSSMPAWSSFDISSVLDAASGGESIEQMVDQ